MQILLEKEGKFILRVKIFPKHPDWAIPYSGATLLAAVRHISRYS